MGDKEEKSKIYLRDLAIELIKELHLGKAICLEKDPPQKFYEQRANIVRKYLRKEMRPTVWATIVLGAEAKDLYYMNNHPCNLSGEELILELAVRVMIFNMELFLRTRFDGLLKLTPEDEFS